MTFTELKASYLTGLQYLTFTSYDETASGGGSGACNVSTAAQTELALLTALNTTGITNTFTTTEAQTYTVAPSGLGINITVGTTVFAATPGNAHSAVRGAAGVEYIEIITPARTGRSYVPRLYPAPNNTFEITGYRNIADVIYSGVTVLVDDTVYAADTPAATLQAALQVVCSRAFFFDEYIKILNENGANFLLRNSKNELAYLPSFTLDLDGSIKREFNKLVIDELEVFGNKSSDSFVSLITRFRGTPEVPLPVQNGDYILQKALRGRAASGLNRSLFALNVRAYTTENQNTLDSVANWVSRDGTILYSVEYRGENIGIRFHQMLFASLPEDIVLILDVNGRLRGSQIYKISDNSPQFPTLSSDTNPAALVTLDNADILRKTTAKQVLDTFPSYDSDAAAITAGLSVGDWYYRPNHGLKKVDA